MSKKEIIINKTPHAIYILDDDEKILKVFPKSKGMIRVAETSKYVKNIGDVPIYSTTWGDTKDVPKPQPGIYYIVSQLVKSALPHRTDLLVPRNIVRDKAGNIIGCKHLDIGTEHNKYL